MPKSRNDSPSKYRPIIDRARVTLGGNAGLMDVPEFASIVSGLLPKGCGVSATILYRSRFHTDVAKLNRKLSAPVLWLLFIQTSDAHPLHQFAREMLEADDLYCTL